VDCVSFWAIFSQTHQVTLVFQKQIDSEAKIPETEVLTGNGSKLDQGIYQLRTGLSIMYLQSLVCSCDYFIYY
jgi:hypothetical protein